MTASQQGADGAAAVQLHVAATVPSVLVTAASWDRA
jgi:hypothetical protein